MEHLPKVYPTLLDQYGAEMDYGDDEPEIAKIVQSTDTDTDLSSEDEVKDIASVGDKDSGYAITVDTSQLDGTSEYMPAAGETLTYIATVACGDFEKTIKITAVTPAETGTVSYALVLKDGDGNEVSSIDAVIAGGTTYGGQTKVTATLYSYTNKVVDGIVDDTYGTAITFLKGSKDVSEATLGDGETGIFEDNADGTATITLNNPGSTSGYALDTGTYTVKAEWTGDDGDMSGTKNLTDTQRHPLHRGRQQ